MTEEELLKKRAAAYKKMMEANLKRKKMTGMVAGDKEIEMLKKSIPTAELDAKFIAEKIGGVVSEKELELIKKLMPR
jgi:hypothetical protein|tara:strand:+ start:306 stop:536 length:231 start_codon:yes stop_codon:yes gene_type:complete